MTAISSASPRVPQGGPFDEAQPTGPAPHVAEIRLDRIASLPAELVSIGASVADRLERIVVMRADLDVLGTQIVDAIYPLVPTVDGVTRRVLLAAKRLIHNGRRPSDADLAVVASAGVDAATVDLWSRLSDALQDAQGELDGHVDELDALVGERLTAVLSRPQIRKALALVARDFSAELGRDPLLAGTRGGRTAVSYLVRASLKPSPLSTLTTVGLYPLEPGERTYVSVPVGLAYRVGSALAAHQDFVGSFTYVPAPAVELPGGGQGVVIPAIVANDQFPWRSERVVDVVAHQHEADSVRDLGPMDGDSMAAQLTAADGRARVARLTRMGLLQPVMPWAVGSDSPLADLADAIAGAPSPFAGAVADALRRIDGLRGQVQHADAPERRQHLELAAQHSDLLTRAVGGRPWTGPLIFEDAAGATPADVPASVTADLRDLGRRVRPYVFRSHIYDILVEQFRTHVGVGGTHPSAAGFLRQIWTLREVRAAVREAQHLDLSHWPTQGGEDRTHLPVGLTSAPPALAVMYQIGADDVTALQRGDYTLVVNQLGGAQGGLVSRFGPLLGRDAVREHLLAWLRPHFPGADVRAVTFGNDVSAVQHSGAGFLPRVEWDRPATPGVPHLNDIALVHDPDSDTLSLRGPDGPVAVLYTGIVPAALTGGPTRLACALFDPWVDGTPSTRANHPVMRAALECTDLIHLDRVHHDRVVSRRERWFVPSSWVPQRLPGERDSAYLIRLDDWRRGVGLPGDVFFIAVGDDAFDSSRRKPMWLDFASPHLVHAALPLIKGTRYIRFDETLPRPQDAWILGDDGPVVAEHVGLLAWERPTGGFS